MNAMPELPEVETVRRTLERLISGKTIAGVAVHLPRIIRKPAEPEAFIRVLEGRTIESVARRGKFLKFMLDGGLVLVSHLRMEGRYGCYEPTVTIDKHTHVIFSFTDGTQLRYKDVRQFGTMDVFRTDELEITGPLAKLGLEPLSDAFTWKAFQAAFRNRTTKIKPLLLNQEYIVGLGNIYVDESLYSSGIHPERAVNTLSGKEMRRLYDAIRRTLHDAVKAGGSSVKSYVDGQGEQGTYQYQLKVYGRRDQTCVRCDKVIVKTVVAGRGTHYCPQCQPL
jgi:formamidopyrimidine-DNA glycosylase